MSLLVKVKKINIEEDEMFCVVDMKTIATYKKITGESFLKGIERISNMDEEVILNLLASSLRYEVNGDPVGLEYLNKFNPLALLTHTMDVIVELVEESLPKSNAADVKKKKVAAKKK